MKILVISLLRVGDVLMSAGVLKALRVKYPDAQIDLLVNSQCRSIAPLLTCVDNMIEFDRAGLQKGLGEASSPIFESYEKLSTLIDELDAQSYDVTVNLTQNRLSGWLMGLIQAKTRIGLVVDQNGRGVFGSNWFRYLNQQHDLESNEVFHFNDIFKNALALDDVAVHGEILEETERGRLEAAEIIKACATSKMICVQALSSDKKKDWGFDRIHKMMKAVLARHPEVTFAVLAAPFEVEALQPFVQSLNEDGIQAVLAVTTFEGAYSLLKQAKLLVTLDTSVKHLAAAAGTRIVEICVGSSDPYRTGADLHGSVIVRSRESCAPCAHSTPCHRSEHFCAKRIPADAVAAVVSETYSHRLFQLRTIADEYKSDIEILRVDRRSLGLWIAPLVNEALSEAGIGRWLDLVCRRLWLHDSKTSFATIGSEMLRVTRFLKRVYPRTADFEWKQMLHGFEQRAMEVEGRVNGFKAGIRYLHGSFEDRKRMEEFVKTLIVFKEKMKTAPLFASFRPTLDQVIEDDKSPAFTRFRHIVEAVGEIEARTHIHLKILRAIGPQIESALSAESL